MMTLACLWNRSRLERYADGVLSPGAARSVGAHLDRCVVCRDQVEREIRLKQLVRSAVADPTEPDWTGFWTGVRTRIARETPRPVKDRWWLPIWKPVWGHPRLAIGSAVAAMLALALAFWPGNEGQIPSAWAAPVVVQDVSAPDPNRSVMVYSTADRALTVIWLFNADGSSEES